MVNSNHHQPSSDSPKKIEEITQDDIKHEAITYAAQFGLHVQKSDCQVTAIPNRLHIAEIGSNTDINLPVTKWIVTISRKSTISNGVAVTVEYLMDGVCATDFKPI